MTSTLTKNYWLDVFSGWVEARDMPGPQNDEALKVIKELKVIASRLRCEIHGTEIVSDPDDPNDDGHCGECVIEDMKAAQHAHEAELLSRSCPECGGPVGHHHVLCPYA